MQIEYTKKAVKYINALDSTSKLRIKYAIERLTEESPQGDIKFLQGYNDGRRRLRVGKYRIIYNYYEQDEKRMLLIMNIDSRGDIYK